MKTTQKRICRRTKSLHVRMSESERKLIEEQAEKLNLTASEYVRLLVYRHAKLQLLERR